MTLHERFLEILDELIHQSVHDTNYRTVSEALAHAQSIKDALYLGIDIGHESALKKLKSLYQAELEKHGDH